MRYESFPEPKGEALRPTAQLRPMCDRKENQFWVCSARCSYRDRAANNGSCVMLDATIGRPSLKSTYVAHTLTDPATINPFLPVIWLIDPASGDVQFCDIRQAGLCVKIGLQ